MASYFITGANRGIGLELCKQLSELEPSMVSRVFAGIRTAPPPALQKLVDSSDGRVVPVQVQVTERSSIDEAAKAVSEKLGGEGLDVLINNAGLVPVTLGSIESMPSETLREGFEVNVVAVHNVIAGFLPLLKEGQQKKIVTISSTVGSITLYPKPDYNTLPLPSYKVSKAALNMLTVNYAIQLKDEGFTVFPMSPGYLKTDTSGDAAHLDVDVGVRAVLEVIINAGPESNGRFRNIQVPGWEDTFYSGNDAPW